MARQTALVIEDDPDVRSLVGKVLTSAGFDVHQSATGRDIETLLEQYSPALVTLDLGLPGVDGLEICRRIRASSDAYVVMVTARADERDRLAGLDLGADDYMTKPFSPRELRARVEAMLRRPRHLIGASNAQPPPESLTPGGGLLVSLARREATYDGAVLPLTRTEFDLLALFAARPGKVFDRDSIVTEIWNSGPSGSDHLVDVHVANLRRKLRQASPETSWIHTVRGVGFRLDPPD
jgi:two-component system OmpR family response regulator